MLLGLLLIHPFSKKSGVGGGISLVEGSLVNLVIAGSSITACKLKHVLSSQGELKFL